MNGLKLLVITLGLMITFSVLLLGYGFYKKSIDPKWRLLSFSSSNDTAFDNKITKQSFGDIKLNLPVNCQIIDTKISRDIIIIQTGVEFICQKIFIYRLKDFSLLGTIATPK